MSFETMTGKRSGDELNHTVVKKTTLNRRCPYLDTINRQYLDFDNEKLCSVSLVNVNVYACLVCGKFFTGRGKTTVAFTHSVEASHYVFMNLHDSKAYCLPDNYEIYDTSLDDIKKCLNPKYSIETIQLLNESTSLAHDIYNIAYLPGFVGLNNLKCTDYINVIIHAISHINPIRNIFLESEFLNNSLLYNLGIIIRKIWSSDNFKSVVSPLELVHVSKSFNQ